jgi:hypothetical protein
MKPFVTFFVSIMLSSVVAGQPYQGGREYKAKNNTYRCEYGIAKSNGHHYYEFTNIQNVLKSKISDIAYERRLLEILYEVYGGKEKMQTMKSETIALDLYIEFSGFFVNWGSIYDVAESKIVITSETDSPQTTIDQVEAIENLVNGCSFGAVNGIYTWGPYTISEIPELLEKMPYQDGRVYSAKKNTYKCSYSRSQGRHHYTFINTRNVLAKINSKTRGEDFEAKRLDSERKLLELLYEVYGGKEKMQAMGGEKIEFRFYIGMDFKVKELEITLITESENPKTTLLQMDAIEWMINKHIRFIFNRESPLYDYAIYTDAGRSYTISEIPELLEKIP